MSTLTWRDTWGHGLPEYQTLIIAGGLGTRLKRSYGAGPKCLAPVNGRPFLEYLLWQLRNAKAKEVILCVGHGADQIESWLEDGRRFDLKVTYSREEKPLGTGGALKHAERHLNGADFIAMNGDSFVEIDILEMYRRHVKNRALATLALVSCPDAERYGSVRLNARREVEQFREKNSDTDKLHSELINAGVYVFQRRLMDYIIPGEFVSLERSILPTLLGKGIYGFETGGYFIDIGIPQDYQRAQHELPRRIVRWL